jgi:ferric-dicitrate binding protein FerR (iron transport regulator)
MGTEDLHRDFDRLLSRYLSGELDAGERAWFEEELARDPGKQDLLDSYRQIWDGAVSDQPYDLDAEWTLLKKKLSGFDTGSGTLKTAAMGRSIRFYTYRIAAILVLGLVLTFSWVYLTRMKGMVRVLAGEQPVEVMLQDGTEITVNRNSTLRYPRSFDLQERRVYLSGEAWFDVARDTSMPFIIDAGAALVEVLGTSFNVNAYRENPTVEITVESGLVAMSAKKDLNEMIVMQAGAGGSYDKSQNQLKLITTPDPNNISWKTRELFFDGSTLQEVCTLVNKVYGVQLVIMKEELSSCPITVTFRDQSLESVLKVLESTLDLQLTREGDVIQLDGEGCVD